MSLRVSKGWSLSGGKVSCVKSLAKVYICLSLALTLLSCALFSLPTISSGARCLFTTSLRPTARRAPREAPQILEAGRTEWQDCVPAAEAQEDGLEDAVLVLEVALQLAAAGVPVHRGLVVLDAGGLLDLPAAHVLDAEQQVRLVVGILPVEGVQRRRHRGDIARVRVR